MGDNGKENGNHYLGKGAFGLSGLRLEACKSKFGRSVCRVS